MWSITDLSSFAFYACFAGFWITVGSVIAICCVAYTFDIFQDDAYIG